MGLRIALPAILLLLVTAFIQPSFAESSDCTGREAEAQLRSTDPFYADGMEVARDLIDHGFIVKCILTPSIFDGAPQAPNVAKRDELYRKVTGMSFQEYNQKLNALRTKVGSVLYRVEAAAPGTQTKDGNCLAVTRWKITAGRGGDYGNYVTNML